MIGLWRVVRLAAAIRGAFPDVPPERALPAAAAIVRHHGDHDPLLVAAIGYGESRFIPSAHNACCCGPMGTKEPRSVCRAIASDPSLGYRLGVQRLDEARAYCLRRGTPTTLCELAVYGSGPRGAREKLYRRPRLVLRRVEALWKAMGVRPGVVPVPEIGGAS